MGKLVPRKTAKRSKPKRPDPASTAESRTSLGKKLREARALIIASGTPLLDIDEIRKMVRENRGGADQDDE